MQVNYTQLRLIKVNWDMSIHPSVHRSVGRYVRASYVIDEETDKKEWILALRLLGFSFLSLINSSYGPGAADEDWKPTLCPCLSISLSVRSWKRAIWVSLIGHKRDDIKEKRMKKARMRTTSLPSQPIGRASNGDQRRLNEGTPTTTAIFSGVCMCACLSLCLFV